jgi:hypothetical protein
MNRTPEDYLDAFGTAEHYKPIETDSPSTSDWELRNGRWHRVQKEDQTTVGESGNKARANGAGGDGPLGPEPPPVDPGDYAFGRDADDDSLGERDIGADDSPIPPRPWLLGSIFCLDYFSSLLGEGGVGKTAVRLLQWLSVATGQKLLGDHVFLQGPVLVVSLEDDYDEMRRRLKAAQIHTLPALIFTAGPSLPRNGTRNQ